METKAPMFIDAATLNFAPEAVVATPAYNLTKLKNQISGLYNDIIPANA